jgi:hypothetical protein
MWTYLQPNGGTTEKGHAITALLFFLLACFPVCYLTQPVSRLYKTVLCVTDRALPNIPVRDHPPRPEILIPMQSASEHEGNLAVVKKFIARMYHDKQGASATQKTAAYPVYDDEGLHIILVTYDWNTHVIQDRLDITIGYRNGMLRTSMKAQPAS